MTPTKWPREDLAGDGPRSRWFTRPAPGDGWIEPVIMEWELRAESWTDEHAHDEYAYVLEGRLFVEAGGVVLEAGAGEMVRVPAGSQGRYWAPVYARMLGVYAPNPEGAPMRNARYEKLPAEPA